MQSDKYPLNSKSNLLRTLVITELEIYASSVYIFY